MGFDNTSNTRTDAHSAEGENEPLNLVGVTFDKEPPTPDHILRIQGRDKLPRARDQSIPVFELPEGQPTVGAGTRYSDIIRDRHQDDVRFHLGPRINRGELATPPGAIERKDVPTSAVPAVPMESVGASAEFQKRMREEFDGLPSPVRKLLADKGMTVVIADNMVDAAPDLKDEHPRGWPQGTTFANEDGAFRPDKREIIVAETFKNSAGQDIRSKRADGVLRHETGHAVDAALDNYSQESDFKAAYDKDVAVLPKDVKAKLEYLLQPDGAGEQETFAEVFAAIYGGSANQSETALILQSFPNVTTLMRQKLASL